MEELGGGGDNLVGTWAVLTYRVDVRDAMERAGMDLNSFDRIEWIREVIKGKHGDELSVLWDAFLQRGGSVPELDE